MASMAEAALKPTAHRFTVAEFERLGQPSFFREDDRIELIEGEIIEAGRLRAAGVSRYRAG